MKLSILAVGKMRNCPEQQLVSTWINRLPFAGKIYEFESSLPAGLARTKDEGKKIQTWLAKHAAKSSHLVCLDKNGTDTSSSQLANLIGKWRDSGIDNCYFVIGGADGHHQNLLQNCDYRIAFGQATWPHMLCRAMLAEQLYRAEMILSGHPYHRS